MSLPEHMNVAAATAYGGPEVVEIQTRPIPRLKDDQILIRGHATTVNSGDARMRGFNVPKGFGPIMRLVVGFTKPRQPVLGTEYVGEIVAVGEKVTRFAVGEEVIAFAGAGMRCHAQYLAIGQDKPLVRKPETLDLEQAAAMCFGGTTALHFLRKADVKPGEKLLVIGASGTVGSALVQLAKVAGAHVTAATSAGNAELARDLGADAVIDYAVEDYTKAEGAWDVIADTVGATRFEQCLGALRPGGRFLAIAGGFDELFTRPRAGKRSIAGMAAERPEDVQYLAQLAGEGRYKPLVDSVFPFEEIAQAHARADTGRKRGSVVVRFI